MRKNTLIFIGLVVLLLAIGYACIRNNNSNNNPHRQTSSLSASPKESSSVNSQKHVENKMSGQAQEPMGVDFELLEHPATDGFGVGPAGAPGLTPEWSYL